MEILLHGLHRPRLLAQQGARLAWVDRDPSVRAYDALAVLAGRDDAPGPMRIRGASASAQQVEEHVRGLAEVGALALHDGRLLWARRQTLHARTLATGETVELAALPGEIAGLRGDGPDGLYVAWNSGSPGIARLDATRGGLVAIARPRGEVRLFDVHQGRAVWLDELTRTVLAATEGEAPAALAAFDGPAHLLALHAGELWLGVGHTLRRLDAQGRELSRTRLTGPAVALAFWGQHAFVSTRAAEFSPHARVGAAIWRLEPGGPPQCLHPAAPRSGGGDFGLMGSRAFDGLRVCEGRLLALDSGEARDDGALIAVALDAPAVEPVLLAQRGDQAS